jgi:hypothetical protein
MHKARLAVQDIGYEQEGFHWSNAHVECHLHAQSAHIAQGVDAAGNKDEGAGDQGIMFGYACTETPDLMPAPLYYAHLILRRINEMRHNSDLAVKGLLPDAKSQVTLRYVDGKPVGATSIVLSTQHAEGMEPGADQGDGEAHHRVEPAAGWMPGDHELYVNPTGTFVIGGPDGDCGLTGRKIIVDTYGGAAPHGGGAFSGKDPTKVDRSAAYARATWPRTWWPPGWPRVHHPGELRHRRGEAALGVFRPARHRPRRGRGEAGQGGAGDDEPLAARHPRAPAPQPRRSTCRRRATGISAARRMTRRARSPGRRPTWCRSCAEHLAGPEVLQAPP